MQQGESIYDVHKRFTHNINHLVGLGITFETDELNIKVLKSLKKIWQPKVMAITKSQNLATMSMATLFRKLREHELEQGRLNEEGDRVRKKIIAFKFEVVKRKKPKEVEDFDDDENTSLMIKKFTKFMKSKNREHHKRYKNENQNFVSNYNYYECGQTGHEKADCPILKRVKKRREKFFKKKKWEDNDSSSSSSSYNSSNDNDYDSLYDSFQ